MDWIGPGHPLLIEILRTFVFVPRHSIEQRHGWLVRLLVVATVAVSSRRMVPTESFARSAGTQQAHDQYGYPYPNAPDCDEGATLNGCVVDAWRFYQGQCTSWVAYRLNQLNGVGFSNSYRQPSGQRWGDATQWGMQPSARGSRSTWPSGFIHVADRPVNNGNSPHGSFDAAGGLTRDTIRVAGWAIDNDSRRAPSRSTSTWTARPGRGRGARSAGLPPSRRRRRRQPGCR